MSDKVIPLEELGKRGTLTLYNQAYVEELKAQIADLEKENAELKEVHESDKRSLRLIAEKGADLEKENKELKEKLNRHKHDCPNCSAFGKHCPHRVNGDPYTYDCYLTVAELEKENAELKEENKKWKDEWQEQVQKENDESYARTLQTIQLNKAKELLKDITSSYGSTEVSEAQLYLKIKRAEQFLKKGKEND